MVGREHFIFKGLDDEEDGEIISSFIKTILCRKTNLSQIK